MCDKEVSSVLSISGKTMITGSSDEECLTDWLCEETMASEADSDSVDMVELDGYDLIEQITAAIEKKDEVKFQRLLQQITICKTNKKYFKQESGSLMATAVMCDSEVVVRHLINAGAQRSNLNSYGDTYILMAIRHNKMSVLKTLTELKQDINSKNKLGHFPLFLAAELNRADALKLLIKAGANVNTKMGRVKMISQDYTRENRVSTPGDSVAHIIGRKIVYGRSKEDTDLYETYREMLFAILDERSFDFAKYCNSILDEMILKMVDDEFIYKRLLRDECQIHVARPYHFLCTMNSKTCVILLEHLKKQQPNVDVLCEGSFTALAVACERLNVDAVQWLLLNGADPNSWTSKSPHRFKWIHTFEFSFMSKMSESEYGTSLTPLHLAVSQFSEDMADKQCKIIKLLIKHGANVNARSSKNYTVLNTALKAMTRRIPFRTRVGMSEEAVPVIYLLLQAGANPDSCFENQTSPGKVSLTLQSCTDEAYKGVILMMMEMSFSLGRDTGLPISEIVHRFRRVGDMISDEMIDRCFCQPRTLLSHCRKVVLDRCKACHLLEVKKHFSVLPVVVQDYLSLKDLLDFTK